MARGHAWCRTADETCVKTVGKKGNIMSSWANVRFCGYLHYTTLSTLHYNYSYNYTTLHYARLQYSTLHCTTLIAPHNNYNCNCNCATLITLHYNYNSTTLHYNYNYNCTIHTTSSSSG